MHPQEGYEHHCNGGTPYHKLTDVGVAIGWVVGVFLIKEYAGTDIIVRKEFVVLSGENAKTDRNAEQHAPQ